MHCSSPSPAPHVKIKRIRNKYIKDLEEKFKKNNILEKLQAITNMVKSSLAREAGRALEKLDRQMTELMLNAKKKTAGSSMQGIMSSTLPSNCG